MGDEEQATNKPAEENKPAASEVKPNGGKTESTGGETPETLKMSTEDMVKRRSRWQSSLAAYRYILTVNQDSQVKLRDSDRATQMALLVVCVATLVIILGSPYVDLFKSQMSTWVGICDALLGAVLVFYVADRFGIITTFTPRQAVLTWQLMFGASLLGIFTAINLTALIGMVVANTPAIEVPGARESGQPLRKLPEIKPLVKVQPKTGGDALSVPQPAGQ